MPSAVLLPDKAPFSVVLIEPRIPQNVGNIARLCACTGATLWLVGELGFLHHEKQFKRAGMDYLDSVHIQHVSHWEAVLEAHPNWKTVFLTTKAKHSLFETRFEPNTLLVFGREDKGLPETFLAAHADHCIRIPMRPESRSLNLASSVAIILYDALRQTLLLQC